MALVMLLFSSGVVQFLVADVVESISPASSFDNGVDLRYLLLVKLLLLLYSQCFQ